MIRSDFAAFIITFNRPEKLYHTVTQLSLQTVSPSKILIVNNGEKIDLDAILISGETVLEQHMMGYNSGPAGGSNFGLLHLASQGFKWIQWVDDDDPPRINNLNERLFGHLTKLKNLNIGIIAPVGSYFDLKSGIAKRVKNADIENNIYLNVQTVGGNQCMLVNSAVINSKCVPTPTLFFGFEDTNFCLKVLNAGFEIVVPCDLFFEYRNLSGRWNLKKTGDQTKMLDWRRYYSIRSLIYMFTYEFKRPDTVLRIIVRTSLKPLYSFIKFQPARGFNECYYNFIAVKDGLFKRLGITVKPVAKH